MSGMSATEEWRYRGLKTKCDSSMYMPNYCGSTLREIRELCNDPRLANNYPADFQSVLIGSAGTRSP